MNLSPPICHRRFCWSCHICDENFTLIWHFLCQNVYGMTDGEDWRGKRERVKVLYKCTIYKPDICRISVGIEPKYIYKAQTLKLFGQKWAKPQDQIWNNLKSSSSIWENPPELPINPNFETMNWVQPNTIRI